MTSWHAISLWWAFLPVGVLFVYGLMKSNYEHYCQLEADSNEKLSKQEQQYSSLREENSRLNLEVADLKRKPRSSISKERDFNAVKSLLEKHEDDDKTVLRLLLKVGSMKHNHGWHLAPLPEGFTHDRTQIALNKLAEDHLVTKETNYIPGGWEAVWQIAPWAAPHLKELL